MIDALIERARRRIIADRTLHSLALGSALVLAAVTFILAAGTEFLDARLIWIVAALAVFGTLFAGFRRLPDRYATAIRLDRNAGLNDTVSTAIHFGSETSDVALAQRRMAESVSARIDLNTAIPFTFPRELYATAALAIAASALFAVRYYSTSGLDLRPPLTEVIFQDLALNKPGKGKQAASESTDRKRLETAESLLAKLGVPTAPDDQKQQGELDKALDQALANPGSAPGDKAQKGQGDKPGAATPQTPAGDPLDGQPQGADDQKDASKPPDGKDAAAGDKGSSKPGSGENSSLMSKLKDAVSNMFSKSNQSDAAGQKGQQQSKGGKSEKGAGEKGKGSKSQDPAQNQAEAQDGEPNGEQQAGQEAQGKAGAKSSQQSSQAGSGVGSQDGAKDLRAAEQLKAMGKISEIIGKRAATVTGETTIEVQSGNQQLRTAYSNSKASHAEADSDVSRDQIPAGLQSYVQTYFEQVRKSAKPAK